MIGKEGDGEDGNTDQCWFRVLETPYLCVARGVCEIEKEAQRCFCCCTCVSV